MEMKRMPPAIHTEWILINVKESPMSCYLARPEGEGPWPAVLVFMEIFGINDHIQDVTRRLASEGFLALAINYYHRTAPDLCLGYGDLDVVIGREHKEKTTRYQILDDVSAAIDYLKGRKDVSPRNRFGSIGFCFGGHVAYIAATLPEIAATASFYGAGIATMSPGGGPSTLSYTQYITGYMLCLFGDQDPLIPIQDTVEIEKALREAEIPHRVLHYPMTGHGFMCNQRGDYHPQAAEDAWERVITLFTEQLVPLEASQAKP
jgi:carboxymethylenebutenolidase